jgi:hypothetical protein
MNPQCPTASVEQHLKIAASLRRFYDAECVLLAWNRQVKFIIRRYLQKDARVWPALVSLSGRMQKTWAKAETGCDFMLPQNLGTDRL